MAKLFAPVAFRRDHVIRFRTTSAEKELLEQMAGDCGMTVSDFCRQQAMSRRFRSRIAATIICRLVALSEEVKSLRERLGRDTPELKQMLSKIAAEVERISVDEDMF